MNQLKKYKILIVDDSVVMQKILTKIINDTSDMQVVGVASNPFEAREKLVSLEPDLMTLDLEMPKMNGIEFLEKVMNHFPTRVVIISSISSKDSFVCKKAFELGAVGVLEKPRSTNLEDYKLIENQIRKALFENFNDGKRIKNSVIKPKVIVAIASSTGGTEALKQYLDLMPDDIPATVIVQHMPAGFTKSFATSLNEKYGFEVKEAEEGDYLSDGRVLIAPGGSHLEVINSNNNYFIKLNQNELLNGVRPSADITFKSIAKIFKNKSIGVVLTGMGKDGAAGLLDMKNEGCFTIAQSEKTCLVFGMPAAAIKLNAALKILDLDKIPDFVLTHIATFKKE